MNGLPKQCPSCGGFCGTTPCSYGEESASGSNDLLCVGSFKIRKEGNLIFIKHSSGESGGFDAVLFEKCIDDFFNENF